MRLLPTLLFILLPLLFCGCSNDHIEKRLRVANRIIDASPDSALIILQQISPSELTSKTEPFYALLYTQAQINTGLRVSSDSLLSIAYNTYTNSSDRDKTIRASYLLGLINFNNGDMRSAMQYSLIAYDSAIKFGPDYWIAKSAQLISDIFFDSYNYDEAIRYAKTAAAHFDIAKEPIPFRYALCDLAIIELNQNKNQEAVNRLESLYNDCISNYPFDQQLADYIRIPLISALAKVGRTAEARELIKTTTDTTTVAELIVLNRIAQNSPQIATNILLQAKKNISTNEERAQLLFEIYEDYKSQKKYEDAIELVDTIIRLQSSIAEDLLKESITGVQRDFYKKRATEQELQSRNIQVILICVLLLSVFMIITLLTIHHTKRKTLRNEIETHIASLIDLKSTSEKIIQENNKLLSALSENGEQLSGLKLTLATKIKKETQLNQAIKQLFKEKWNTLNMLCNEYFELGTSEITRTAIINNIEKELRRLKTPKEIKHIENAVNEYMDNLIIKLKGECPFLKEPDIVFLTLIYAGFTVRSVCLFTGIKYKLYYLKKSRLVKKISESDAIHKSEFLASLQ